MAQHKALVVGGSGGIGSAISVALAKAGIESALIGRNKEALTATAEECAEAGTNAHPIVCDISQIATIEAAVRGAIDRLGALNFLINCAGVSIDDKLHETDLEGCDALLDINLRSHYHLTRYALPEINRQPGGAVIKIGAVNHPRSGANLYLAANRGVEGYAEALFKDVREFGTRVCTIKPGYVNTPLVRSADLNSALMIQPEDISRTVLFVLSMPETACPTEIIILPQRSPYR